MQIQIFYQEKLTKKNKNKTNKQKTHQSFFLKHAHEELGTDMVTPDYKAQRSNVRTRNTVCHQVHK